MSRALFILVTIFWTVMSVLLWREEFGSAKTGGTVSPETVWEKILTAPDDSSLNVLFQGRRIGFCRWRTGVGEAWAKVSDENIPTRLSESGRGFRLRAEGSIILEDAASRLRFEADLQLDGQRELHEMRARVTMRPAIRDFICIVSNKMMEVSLENESGLFRRTFHMTDLKNPESLAMQLLQLIAGDWLSGAMLSGIPVPSGSSSKPNVAWESTVDWTKIGHTPVQIYRLHTRLIQHFDVNIFVSRAGEILRVELPNEITLVNDQLHSM